MSLGAVMTWLWGGEQAHLCVKVRVREAGWWSDWQVRWLLGSNPPFTRGVLRSTWGRCVLGAALWERAEDKPGDPGKIL